MSIKQAVVTSIILIIILFIYTLLPQFIFSVDPETKLYKVIEVVDGDTIIVDDDGKRLIIRLLGIDTPELHKPNTTVQCYAKEAYEYTKQLIENKYVRLKKDIEDKDVYNRYLRYVYLDDKMVNTEIAKNGYAYLLIIHPNRFYQQELISSVNYAVKQEIGLWKYCIELDTRVEKYKNTNSTIDLINSSDLANPNCIIKGNISKSTKIYHLPNQKFYDKIKINISEGDKWFCTEEDAIKSGFKKSKT